MDAFDGFQVGDYVIAPFAQFDDFTDQTFIVVQRKQNLLGEAILGVVSLREGLDVNAALDGRLKAEISFYPRELRLEDWTEARDAE